MVNRNFVRRGAFVGEGFESLTVCGHVHTLLNTRKVALARRRVNNARRSIGDGHENEQYLCMADTLGGDAVERPPDWV